MTICNYDPTQCDIRDRAQLEKYRNKRTEWLRLLEEDDNSVFNQINAMMWNCAVFHTVNESRRLAHASGGRAAALNGLLAEFIDLGFVAVQALAIRKLLDPAGANDARQVVSLRRVLDDINQSRRLITREMYVCYDGLPYDYATVKDSRMEALMRRATATTGVVVESSPLADLRMLIRR